MDFEALAEIFTAFVRTLFHEELVFLGIMRFFG